MIDKKLHGYLLDTKFNNVIITWFEIYEETTTDYIIDLPISYNNFYCIVKMTNHDYFGSGGAAASSVCIQKYSLSQIRSRNAYADCMFISIGY